MHFTIYSLGVAQLVPPLCFLFMCYFGVISLKMKDYSLFICKFQFFVVTLHAFSCVRTKTVNKLENLWIV